MMRPHTRESNVDNLTSVQRAQLRKLAHPLKPILQIGKEGVTPSTVEAVREAFNTRELLKVKVLDSAPASARSAGEEIVRGIAEAHLVQTIGRVAVLYRPDPDAPEIDPG